MVAGGDVGDVRQTRPESSWADGGGTIDNLGEDWRSR
jgi:hypothetical protein